MHDPQEHQPVHIFYRLGETPEFGSISEAREIGYQVQRVGWSFNERGAIVGDQFEGRYYRPRKRGRGQQAGFVIFNVYRAPQQNRRRFGN